MQLISLTLLIYILRITYHGSLHSATTNYREKRCVSGYVKNRIYISTGCSGHLEASRSGCTCSSRHARYTRRNTKGVKVTLWSNYGTDQQTSREEHLTLFSCTFDSFPGILSPSAAWNVLYYRPLGGILTPGRVRQNYLYVWFFSYNLR